jgi:hypothetical protein
MRIKGGGARVMVGPVGRRNVGPSLRLELSRDVFEVTPVKVVPPARHAVTVLSLVDEFLQQGRARVERDQRERDAAQLVEIGRLLGALSAAVVIELINHFVQHPPPRRSSAMISLGALTGALFVEYLGTLGGDALEQALWTATHASDALERFITFLEQTEGQPARRLVGTLYALELRES